jgi:carboxylesterase
VVAFHGFTGTTSELRPMLERLGAAGYAVHASLLPGHGTHPSSLQEATFDHWVDAMRGEVIKARERHEEVVLCGFSLGSLVAIELAAEGLGAGLVLLGTAVTLTAPVRTALGAIDRLAWRLPDWYLLKLWASDIADPVQRRKIRAYDRDPLRAALEVYRGGRRAEAKLGKITCPTLLIHGAKDRVCPVSNAHDVASRLGTTDTVVRVYPSSAHLVAADVDRHAVAEDVLAFVSRLARDGDKRQREPVEP